jgi:hypothetical protein
MRRAEWGVRNERPGAGPGAVTFTGEAGLGLGIGIGTTVGVMRTERPSSGAFTFT